MWPAVVLLGLVLAAIGLVAAVIVVNPGIFRKEFKSQFLLVSFDVFVPCCNMA